MTTREKRLSAVGVGVAMGVGLGLALDSILLGISFGILIGTGLAKYANVSHPRDQ